MEEKTLVVSKRGNVAIVLITVCLIGLILGVLLSAALYGSEIKASHKELAYAKKMYEKSHYGKWLDTIEEREDEFEKELKPAVTLTAECFVVAAVIGGVLCFAWSKTELSVTDKRVYGKAAFGKRVDLPLDSVSSISSQWPQGISVATSSGKIAFLMIKNRDEIHKCVSDLLIDRQRKVAATTPTIKQESPMSNAEELKKYKELLDMGVITQEEFDAKKKQLLGL